MVVGLWFENQSDEKLLRKFNVGFVLSVGSVPVIARKQTLVLEFVSLRFLLMKWSKISSKDGALVESSKREKRSLVALSLCGLINMDQDVFLRNKLVMHLRLEPVTIGVVFFFWMASISIVI